MGNMSSTLNLVMTTIGFLVSAIFIMFVLLRLFCACLQSQRFAPQWAQRSAGAQRTSGMDPLLLTLFPTIKFNGQVFTCHEDATCAVCLAEYEQRDSLRILPQCGHAFHVSCIDAWLRRHSTCPVCRIYLQSSPVGRNMPSPLLSDAARSRFSPGAIPESLFEQPLLDPCSPVSEPGSACHSSQAVDELTSNKTRAQQGGCVLETGTVLMKRSASQRDAESNSLQSIGLMDGRLQPDAYFDVSVQGGPSEIRRCETVNSDELMHSARLSSASHSENRSKGLLAQSQVDTGSTVQVCIKRDASFDGGNCKSHNSFAPRCSVGEDEGRSSFSAWVRHSQEKRLSDAAHTNRVSGKEIVTDERQPQDVVLGWTSIEFHTSIQDCADIRLKVDGMCSNSLSSG